MSMNAVRIEPSQDEPRPPTLRRWIDKAGELRWRVVGANGEVIAACTEGYTSRQRREDSINLTLQALMLDDLTTFDDA